MTHRAGPRTKGLTPDLERSLLMAAENAADALDPWWIIGSTAVALHGGEVGPVKDVDLMMSARDAQNFLEKARVAATGVVPSDRFRSQIFGTWNGPPIPVEVFGGFEVFTGGEWRPVFFATRQTVNLSAAALFVPSRAELIDLLRTFGRPKDLQRAELIADR